MQCQRKLFRFGKLSKGLSLSGSYFRPFRFGPHFCVFADTGTDTDTVLTPAGVMQSKHQLALTRE